MHRCTYYSPYWELWYCGNSIFNEFSNVVDHNSASFYGTPLIQAQPHSEKIRNRTIPIIILRNRLNFLSNDEEHGLVGIPTME